MENKSYIRKRLKKARTEPFPVAPRFDIAMPCWGVIYVGRNFGQIPDLKSIRDNVTGLWEFEIVDNIPAILLTFSAALKFPSVDLCGALALQCLRLGVLSSFAMEDGAVYTGNPGSLHAVNIWWNGKSNSIQMRNMRRLSLARFWPEPEITLHNSFVYERVQLSHVHSALRRSASERADKQVKVKVAAMPTDGAGGDVFEGTDKSLNRISHQTTLKSIFGRLFTGRFAGQSDGLGEGKGGQASGAGTGQPHSGPGFIEGLAGWVKWHTPLGSGIAKQFGERLNLVEKLLSKGDVDSALKLALKLGGKSSHQKGPSRFPWKLPDMRSGLDYDFSGGGMSMPILGGRTHETLWQRYVKLARELEEKGDFKRAAYVRSQLLENHYEAVKTLERGELFEDAAKLSLDSRQSPVMTIELYFKAGKTDMALALAKRTDCFDKLVDDSRESHPEFHAYVVKAWTDRLLATGQPLRALEVTDDLVRSQQKGSLDHDLAAQRLVWLEMALEQARDFAAEPNAPYYRTELLVRALLYAAWDLDGPATHEIEAFPYGPTLGQGPYLRAVEHIQMMIEKRDSGSLLELLTRMTQEADPKRIDQTAFWQGPSQILLDSFTRETLGIAGAQITVSDMKAIRKLAQYASLPVLGAELSKIKHVKKGVQTRPNIIHIPAPQDNRTIQIQHACILSNGSMVLWYDTERLELRNRDGYILWNGQVSNVTGLIPVGASPSVIMLRKHGEFETRVTRFETHKRRFVDIGITHLAAHHDAMSDGQWLVQIDNQIGGIDTVKMMQDPPEMEYLWSVETSNEMKVMGFLNAPNAPSWLTRNMSSVRFGVMQVWQFTQSRNLQSYICLPQKGREPMFLQDQIHWQWAVRHGSFQQLSLMGLKGDDIVRTVEPNFDCRKKAIGFAQRRQEVGFAGQDTVQICDFSRMSIMISNNLLVTMPGPQETNEKFSVKFEGEVDLRLLARGTRMACTPAINKLNDTSRIVLCTDKYGRLIRIDTDARRADIL